MIDIKVVEKKLAIDGEEFTFRFDFKALLKFEEKYDNAIDIFNNFLQNKKVYNAITKILSCSCVERDFTEEELAEKLGFSLVTMQLADEITLALVTGTLEKPTKKAPTTGKSAKN
jgi:hypothetical protein